MNSDSEYRTPALIFPAPPAVADPGFARLDEYHRADETRVVDQLIDATRVAADSRTRIAAHARRLVAAVRDARLTKGGLDAFLHEYGLSSDEGVVLMCLAESLLRIPDAHTADLLIRDTLGDADWEEHLGHSESLFVNASTWALMLTGRVVALSDYRGQTVGSVLGRLASRFGEPLIRRSVRQAMRIIGRQFVLGRHIDEALERAAEEPLAHYRFSFDMLGEAARTQTDADRYWDAYRHAIDQIGAAVPTTDPIRGAGISIKLSALHPRYEVAQRDRVLHELTPRLAALAVQAAHIGIGLTVDAEEADRLELSLEILAAVSADGRLRGWDGLGLAVQAYQKRALPVLAWLRDRAQRDRRRFMVRLVKGAYWDTEIKVAQERGLRGYPVFTRKAATDVSFLACARRLLAAPDCFYPQFATHNAHTVAAVMDMGGPRDDFEFQRLHGMGEGLYEALMREADDRPPCRVYAPVGSHEDLLPYLVRRLLENGANSSFVNRVVDARVPIERIIVDPVETLRRTHPKPHPHIPLPRDLYPDRQNSYGIDTSNPRELAVLAKRMHAAAARPWEAYPLVGGAQRDGDHVAVRDPTDTRRVIGTRIDADPRAVADAFDLASAAQARWDATPPAERAACLERMADALEGDTPRCLALLVREAGKTLADAVAEVREAIDYCRYYAMRCRADFEAPLELPGPTGESNRLSLHGRGVFACISPWNFPLAIFTGQIAAALAAGNAVLAKPAEQTPLIAAHAVQRFLAAGVPAEILHLLPGDGATIGAALVADPRVGGVAFTGSVDTAHRIHRTLAGKPGPIVPLIAETGGQNALLVDSSALPEQVVADVLASAFGSAGQRCSALRVLFVQDDVADTLLRMLIGAMQELVIGDPGLLATDIGPVIDREALDALNTHVRFLNAHARHLYTCELPSTCAYGTFFAPRAFEIESIDFLDHEVFGPILHVVRYPTDALERVIDAINATGYGLTLGIHSRIDSTIEKIHRRLRVGNTYVNRSQIGAVVGVQPFGGEGLSGTGPKAGGPHYLPRFATERTLTINTTAQGGNTSLLSLQEDS